MKSVTSQRRRFASGRAGRTLVALLALLLVVALVAIAVGCGGDDGGTAASPSAGGAIKTGGVLKIGSQPGNVNFDPALFAGAVPDILLQQQIYEKLVTLGQDLSVQPTLATKWDSPDGKVWTFTLRDGVKFSNGQDFTSADVVYTMDRLRSKKLGSAMADVYVNIKDVSAPDPATVTFTLKSVDSEFPASLTDYHTLMLCKTVSNPKKNAVGTGPFVLESISAEDRAILKKNPNYWGTDADGTKLPYLDEIDIVYSPDPAGQIEGLQGGTLNWVGGLTAEQKQAVEANTSLKTITTNTNYCFELQIRTDQKPGSDLKVRQAIMAGTDRQAIVDLVAPGLAQAGQRHARRPRLQGLLSRFVGAVRPGEGQAAARRRRLRERRQDQARRTDRRPRARHRHRLAGADEGDRHRRLHPAGPAGRVLRRRRARTTGTRPPSASSTTARGLCPTTTSSSPS